MTTRIKGFAHSEAMAALQGPGFHEPELRRMSDAVVVEDQVTEEHVQALLSGRPVVAADYQQALRLHNGFESYPDKIIESSRSAHAVSFGRFMLNDAGILQPLSVAIKPFMRAETALHELQGYMRLQEMMVQTYQPVGIFPAKHGEHFVAMTKKREDIISLDRDKWLLGSLPKSASDMEIAQRNTGTIEGIAGAMAYIHGQGLFHPDGQIKNWAVTPSGEISVIDTENHIERPLNHADAPALAWEDLDKLVKSLIVDGQSGDSKMFGVGVWAYMPLQHVRNKIEQEIIRPYCQTLEEMRCKADVLEQLEYYDQLERGILDQFKTNEDWPAKYIGVQQRDYSSAK